MSRGNISIFVPHIGCPHKCSFCDQNIITGSSEIPRAAHVEAVCRQALREMSDPTDSEIAFFGGSFTAIPSSYMSELLTAAQPFVGEGLFKGIRISTRPDCIDEGILSVLKENRVTAIELGAQSMCDEVLAANERGHTAEDEERAAALIREQGFELGLQMMIGLYKSSPERERQTVERVIALRPHTARLYPTCILEGTRLAQLYKSGEYKPMDFDEVLDITCMAARELSAAGVKILRIGLHSSDSVEKRLVGGFYHPAYGELVRSLEIRRLIEEHIKTHPAHSYTVSVCKYTASAAAGHKKANKMYFQSLGLNVTFKEDNSLMRDEIKIDRNVYHVFKIA